jgi:TrmH family RNA methyltransferase
VIPLCLDFVRALGTREARDETGCYAIEGVRFLLAAVDAGARIEGLAVCRPLLTSAAGCIVVRRLRQRAVPELRLGEAEYASVSRLADGGGRGVIAIARQRWNRDPSIGHRDLWLAVESMRSPGNLGSLLRTCVAVGARGVFVLGDVDAYHPGCVRATMGAIEGIELARTTPEDLAGRARRAGARILGAAPEGPRDFRGVSYDGATVLALGCERRGLSEPMRRACHGLVRIPMVGRLDSLNVAVAGSVLLYAAFAQRHPVAGDNRGPDHGRPQARPKGGCGREHRRRSLR